MPKPLVIAHRGASSLAPENTMAAFEIALDIGADALELDVQLSRDGQVAVIHDETLERTTGSPGWVAQRNWEDLRRLDAGAWFGDRRFDGQPIPSLKDVLDLVSPGTAYLHIELKTGIVSYPHLEDKVIEMLRRYRLEERATISSFNHYTLANCRRLHNTLALGLLHVAKLYQPWTYASQLAAASLHPLYHGVDPELVRHLQDRGYRVYPWTVNDTASMGRLLQAGVDGLATDRPQDLLELLREGPGQ